jgi:hypothetical protein
MAEIRVFPVDFNDVGGADGRTIEVLPPDGTETPVTGERVVLLDGELNSCWGSVRGVDEHGIALIEVDLDSWAEPRHEVGFMTRADELAKKPAHVAQRYRARGFGNPHKSATRHEVAA